MSIPWVAVVLLVLFILVLILAFGEVLNRQAKIAEDVVIIRNAVQTVARKAGERLTDLESRCSGPACPVQDRRNKTPRRRAEDLLYDSNFAGDNKLV